MGELKKETIISFYDSIAFDYEGQLTNNDKLARKEIAQLFSRFIQKGNILDFGGGTGLDLDWLLSANYKVFFLEPSANMRAVAKRKSSPKPTIFIEDNLDISSWSLQNLPVDAGIDGVLANFAVLNCVKDINLFFEKIALICNEGCHLVLTVIDPRFTAVMQNYSLRSAVRLIIKGKIIVLNKNNQIYHETHLHSLASFRKAYQAYFQLKLIYPVRFSNFVTLVLVRK